MFRLTFWPCATRRSATSSGPSSFSTRLASNTAPGYSGFPPSRSSTRFATFRHLSSFLRRLVCPFRDHRPLDRDERQEIGDGRQETGDGRRETRKEFTSLRSPVSRLLSPVSRLPSLVSCL